jgi:hypothetical protein
MIATGPLGRRGAVVACACLGVLGGVISTVAAARAQGDDRAAAEALVTPADKAAPVTAEALARAREALEQGTRLRAAGDEAHAKAADGLAREWAETARDLALAAAAEKQADERRRQALQAQAQLERTRALVEDGIARLGRIRAELAATPTKVAVEVHDGDRTTPSAPPSALKGRASVSAPSSPSAPGGSSNGSTP